MTYQEQLKTVFWEQKRLQIFKRDKFQCTACSSKDSIQVHHIIYISGKMYWQYPNKLLITLCKKCHTQIHKLIPTIIVSGKSLIFKHNK